MKILMVSKGIHPEDIGGIEKHTQLILSELCKKHEITLLIPGKHSKEYNISNIRVVRVKSKKISNAPVPLDIKPFRKIYKKNYDIVHIHEPNPLFLLFLSPYIILKKPKLIITKHSVIVPHTFLMKIFSPFYYTWLKLLGKMKKTKVIITTPTYIQLLRNIIDKNKVVIIPNPVEEISIKKISVKDKFNNKIILFVGRLVKFKGVNYLIEAFEKVVKKIPEAKLHIVGTGPEMETLKKLVNEKGLQDKVFFLGRVSDEKLEEEYKKSSILVLPSVEEIESFGIVLVEAMMRKTPVITTNLTGPSYVVGDSGEIVPLKNSKKLADAIISLLNNFEKYKNMSKKGFKRAKIFTVKEVARKIEKLYYS